MTTNKGVDVPDPYQRIYAETAKKRLREKYMMCDDDHNPHFMFPPLREQTNIVREALIDKTWIHILTQIGINKYILARYYIYCEEDLWVCGEALVFNQNPDKKIMIQPYCCKTRKECPCHDSHSHEFFTICPNCRKIIVAVKNTDLKCKYCEQSMPHSQIHKLPWLKLDCEWCPVEIGWEQVHELNKTDKRFYLAKLITRDNDGNTNKE